MLRAVKPGEHPETLPAVEILERMFEPRLRKEFDATFDAFGHDALARSIDLVKVGRAHHANRAERKERRRRAHDVTTAT